MSMQGLEQSELEKKGRTGSQACGCLGQEQSIQAQGDFDSSNREAQSYFT